MNEDHRDPDWNCQVELLQKAIKSLDTGHWPQVEVSMTGRNADLEVTGHQGFGFQFSLHAAYVHVCPMAMKRHVITDVVLNLPGNTPPEEYEESLKWYLHEAAEMVSAHWKPTERDGSDWISTHQGRIYDIEVLRVDSTDEIDIDGTVAAVIAAFRDGNSSWDEEMTRLHQQLQQCSGWLRFNATTGQYEQLPPAKPRPSPATPEQKLIDSLLALQRQLRSSASDREAIGDLLNSADQLSTAATLTQRETNLLADLRRLIEKDPGAVISLMTVEVLAGLLMTHEGERRQ